MNLMTGLRSVAALVLAVSVAACQRPGPAPEVSGAAFEAYVATPAHQAETLKAAKTTGRWLASGCTSGQSFSPSRVTAVTSPVAFAPDGMPLRGIWMERLSASGCGSSMLLNVAWIAGTDRIIAGSMAPGATRANPLLQTSATRDILLIARKKTPSCGAKSAFLYDTVADPTAPGVAPDTWSERWTLSSCDKRLTVPVDFMPDGQGGTKLAIRDEAAVVESVK
jgi:hypothetical protein